MKIYLGGDHGGFDLKEQLEAYLREEGHDVEDLGNTAFEEADDYPDFAAPVAKAIQKDPEARGILLCSNGEGVCIVANKFRGIRAIVGFSEEATTRARNDDDANILCLPGSYIDLDAARTITKTFLSTVFASDAERHVRRLKKIENIEDENLK